MRDIRVKELFVLKDNEHLKGRAASKSRSIYPPRQRAPPSPVFCLVSVKEKRQKKKKKESYTPSTLRHTWSEPSQSVLQSIHSFPPCLC